MSRKKDLIIEENMALIHVSHYDAFVVPLDDAIKIMSALKYAESAKIDYSGNIDSIGEVGLLTIKMEPLSKEEYRKVKIANLLQIPSKELTELQIKEFL